MDFLKSELKEFGKSTFFSRSVNLISDHEKIEEKRFNVKNFYRRRVKEISLFVI